MRGRKIRATAAAVAIAAATGAAAGSAHTAPTRCGGWQIDTVATIDDQLENLEPDGQGGFYLSGDSRIHHLDAAGQLRTVLTDLTVPRGLQRSGPTLLFASGDSIQQWDTTTGERSTVAQAASPNGLLRLPNGDLLTSWVGTDIGVASPGVTRYHHDTGTVQPHWSTVPRSEGLTLSPDHRAVYTDDLFTGQIIRIPLDTPNRWQVVATIANPLAGVDDLTMSRTGDLYVAAHLEGVIYRLDPATGATCLAASGLPSGWTGPSSVRIAPDGDRWALYATAFDGTLRRLRPPPDVDLQPV
ncbi:SMP-30/gluconolactonase/LRE family protein [Nocardia transvalensis]|uniref:SMP-30/gluconolactonase/LRE family protein n=1 Tax=Nocardia transvalensis TaxID=37333 RepID=UPI001894ED38|nr:SMP-30/gluconolactonase/LRE family protein [Nocardia transvalensis]MBF6328406.1 SMP-30/gluconolactonase/LRE family protein [Nocardia transvalensis]